MSTRPYTASVGSRLDEVLRVGATLKQKHTANAAPPTLGSLSLNSKRAAPTGANDAFTPLLFEAVEQNDVPRAKRLLQGGASVHVFNHNRQTPLTFAIENENLDMVRLLIQHGAEVFEGSFWFNSFWQKNYSATGGAHPEEIINFLFQEKKIGIDQLDFSGSTLLIEALLQSDCDLAKRLLEAGADVNIPSRCGTTALMVAVEHERCNHLIVTLIEKGALIDAQDVEGDTVLMRAVNSENEEAFKMLLAEGADITLLNREGDNVERVILDLIYNPEVEEGIHPEMNDLQRMLTMLRNHIPPL